MSSWIVFAFGIFAGASSIVVFAPLILAPQREKKQEQPEVLTLQVGTRKDAEELADGINVLIRALRWYAEGDNHPSTRVASLALVEFYAKATSFVDGKGGGR